MREEFYENSAAPRNEKLQKAVYIVNSVFFVFSIILSCVFFYCFLIFGDIGFVIFTVFMAGLAVSIFFIRNLVLNYYDYTYISGEVRIIKVINGKRRKKMLVFNCNDVYLLGKVGSESFDKLYDSKDIKRHVLAPDKLNTDCELFYVGVKIDGENCVVVMQVTEQFMSYILSISGKTTLEKDYNKNE